MITGPMKLSETEVQALDRAVTLVLLRRAAGFRAGSGKRVDLATADSLISKGLCKLDYEASGGPRLVVTPAGRLQRDLIMERRRRWHEAHGRPARKVATS